MSSRPSISSRSRRFVSYGGLGLLRQIEVELIVSPPGSRDFQESNCFLIGAEKSPRPARPLPPNWNAVNESRQKGSGSRTPSPLIRRSNHTPMIGKPPFGRSRMTKRGPS